MYRRYTPVRRRPCCPCGSYGLALGSRPYPRPRRICLHIITFGISRGRPQIPIPTIMTLDLSTARAPPRHLCGRFTGIDPEISHHYFSVPGHEAHYMNAMHTLTDVLREIYANPASRSASDCIAVLVNCRAGMHRSVAVAERMAMDVERSYGGEGVEVVVEHLDTDVERGLRRERRARASVHGIYYAGPVGRRYGGY